MARVPRCHMVAQRSATAILGSFVATELDYFLSPLLILQHACVSLEVIGWNSALDLGAAFPIPISSYLGFAFSMISRRV